MAIKNTITHFHIFLVKNMLASAKALVYGNSVAYVHRSYEIIYCVAKNNVASTVNRKLGEGVH